MSIGEQVRQTFILYLSVLLFYCLSVEERLRFIRRFCVIVCDFLNFAGKSYIQLRCYFLRTVVVDMRFSLWQEKKCLKNPREKKLFALIASRVF